MPAEFDTLDELKADLKKKLEDQQGREAEEAFETALIDQLVEKLQGEIPEAMFTNRVDQDVREFDYRLQSQGLNLDMYLQYTGMDMDSFRAGFREQAEKKVKIRLALRRSRSWRISRLRTTSWKRSTRRSPSSTKWKRIRSRA